MDLAPIILFTYKRLKHTVATVEALQKNTFASLSDLIIFSDAPLNAGDVQNVQEVRSFLRTISGFRSVKIIERTKNFGLDKNIINGVTEIVKQYGKVIVLEDDLQTSPFFLEFMNAALTTYYDDENVIAVHGYLYPVKAKLPETFFVKGADCWGWATWERGWANFEDDGKILLKQLIEGNHESSFNFNNAYPFTEMLKDQIDGKNRSWAIRWYASAFLKDMYTLYPGKSLVLNIGGDGSGVNVGIESLIKVQLAKAPIKVEKIDVQQNDIAFNAFAEFHSRLYHPSLFYKIRRKIKKMLTQIGQFSSG